MVSTSRTALPTVERLLAQFPAVVLLGPRQTGKTTLARTLCQQRASVYLDMERPSDQRRLEDPESFLLSQQGKLVVLDEVQRLPELFPVLRSIIDVRREQGEQHGQFLLLGPASGTLLRQSSESLAGRVARTELHPFLVPELIPSTMPAPSAGEIDRRWVRGGFPLSWFSPDDESSLLWREQFILSYLERDIPALGPRIPSTRLRRLWTMLAHNQGQLLDQSRLAASLGVSGATTARYIDILCDLMLVRRLPPWHNNTGKRLVRSPKVYVRDSGLVHALLGLATIEDVRGHPVAGGSWEGFVIEQIIACASRAESSFYRTSHGAEADLVLEHRRGEVWVIEVKLSSAPQVSRGFHNAAADLNAVRKIVVAPVQDGYRLRDGVEVMSLRQVLECVGG